MTDYQRIFALAQTYAEPQEIDAQRWAWPTGTWLQRRRAEVLANETAKKKEGEIANDLLQTLKR